MLCAAADVEVESAAGEMGVPDAVAVDDDEEEEERSLALAGGTGR